MIFQVTQEDIDNGVKCECNECPVALSVLRTLQEAGVELDKQPFVFTRFIQIGIRGMAPFLAPNHVIMFIHKFDHGLEVEPFNFELPLEVHYGRIQETV